MSTYIAQKKAQRKSGPEIILYGMAAIQLLIAAGLLIIVMISKLYNDATMMTTLILITTFGSISLAIGSLMRENEQNNMILLHNWMMGMIFMGLFVGILYGAYMW